MQGEPAWSAKAFAEKAVAALIVGESCIGKGGATTGFEKPNDKKPPERIVNCESRRVYP
jgi:hypothetical protein